MESKGVRQCPDTTSTKEDSPPSDHSSDDSVIPLTSITCYQVPLDERTSELALLQDLRNLLQESPAVTNTIQDFKDLFPHFTKHLFGLIMGRESLRRSFVAMMAILRDMIISDGNPSQFYLVQKTKSLRLLQEDISKGAIDESLCFSLIAQISTENCTGDIRAMNNHLGGVYLVFQSLRERAAEDKAGTALSPMTLLLRRILGRIEYNSCLITEEFPRWPPFTPLDEMEDRIWLSEVTGISKGLSRENIEWALAAFEIDNLWHRAFVFAKLSDIYRSTEDPQAEVKIEIARLELKELLEVWKRRRVVVDQERLDCIQQFLTPINSFELFAPCYLTNRFYSKLQNQWRAISLHISFIVHPMPGPDPVSDNRLRLAMDICQTHAALGNDGFVGTQWHCLFYAGLVFRKNSQEREWVLARLRQISARYTLLRPMIENIPAAWDVNRVHWNALGRLKRSM